MEKSTPTTRRKKRMQEIKNLLNNPDTTETDVLEQTLKEIDEMGKELERKLKKVKGTPLTSKDQKPL